MVNTIDIPLKDSDQVIEIQIDNLPEYNKLLPILKLENPNLHIWINLALEYHKKGNSDALVRLLESSREFANLQYKDSKKDQMIVLNMLAGCYVETAKRERNKDERRELFTKAEQHYGLVDQSIMRDTVTAHVGKAYIAFDRKDYKGALAYFEKALHSNSQCPADVRLGMAQCFLKLGYTEKARLEFEHALQLDSKCFGAIVGLAIMKLNGGTPADIQFGVDMLLQAYAIDSTNTVVLNNLSFQFFFKQDYAKSEFFARKALQNTDNEAMRAEICYHIGRIFHEQNKYNEAFKYYKQAAQLAPVTFVLPLYQLGIMYMYKSNKKNAAQCFEKVLKAAPGNYEVMKLVGLLYADSKNQQKRDIAKMYLKKATEHFPDDAEIWISLAQILGESDLQESLSAYGKAMCLMRNRANNYIPPEILNNLAALNYKLNNMDESCSKLEESLSLSKKIIEADPHHYNTNVVTTMYNLARVYEDQCQFQKAETIYKNILKEHPSYIDCYLRLGCMARDRNHLYEASIWFKKVLGIDNKHPNAWLLLGNLRIAEMEWGSAQQIFEHVLKNPSTSNDSYSLIALGNICLQTLYQPTKNKIQEKLNQDLALQIFTKVLKNDPRNIWAANGIGCVIAHKHCINEARDIFAQVIEATTDFCDVWLNIAHIYVEQKQYNNAIKMYKNCMKKFFKHDNVEVLKYLGHAYFIAGKFKEAKTVFLKARRVAPQDTVIIYNIAFVLQKLGTQILEDDKLNMKDVLKSVYELELSHKYFKYLFIHGDHMSYDVSRANTEANRCIDLLSQVQYHVAEARKKDNDVNDINRKLELLKITK